MESCVLPLELCERVMDALPDYVKFPDSGWLLCPVNSSDLQRALCACALTCQAWRVRAQYLLWTFPALFDSQHFARFKSAIRNSPNTPIIRGLRLGSGNDDNEAPDLGTAGELLMHSFPHLQSLLCGNIRFDHGPPLRVLRMGLPFFANINTLVLVDCTFQSLRSILDVVWACPNLATLVIGGVEVKSKFCSAAGFQNLCATAENLRACRKRTRLKLDGDTINQLWNPAKVGLTGVGRVFGCAVTELQFHTKWAPGLGVFISIIEDSFPALRSVKVVSAFAQTRSNEETPHPPWLHAIALGRPICGILKTIVLERAHRGRTHEGCCEEVVGTSEEVVGSAQDIPELLPELAELVIRLDRCKYPETHAAYIWDVLPGMHNVLRFEYRTRWDDAWKPYAVLSS